MITITKLIRTCYMCPSQWDGWDEDGQQYYFRFRWGSLSVCRCDNNKFGEELFRQQLSNGWEGHIELEVLKTVLKHIMVFNCEEENEKYSNETQTHFYNTTRTIRR